MATTQTTESPQATFGCIRLINYQGSSTSFLSCPCKKEEDLSLLRTGTIKQIGKKKMVIGHCVTCDSYVCYTCHGQHMGCKL